MPEANKAVNLVVALAVAGLMAAFLLPVGIDAMTGDETQTITMDSGETVELQGDLNATLDSADGTGATYTLDYNDDSATATVSEGSNETVTVGGNDVTIGVTNATSTTATADFSYATTLGWGGGAASLWFILPTMLVLAVFLYFVGIALKRM